MGVVVKVRAMNTLYGDGGYKENQKQRKQGCLYNGVVEDLFMHRALWVFICWTLY